MEPIPNGGFYRPLPLLGAAPSSPKPIRRSSRSTHGTRVILSTRLVGHVTDGVLEELQQMRGFDRRLAQALRGHGNQRDDPMMM